MYGSNMPLKLSRLDLILTLRITKAQKAEKYLINPQPAPAFPGLVGTELNTETGKFITLDGGWEAGVDSFIEVSKF